MPSSITDLLTIIGKATKEAGMGHHAAELTDEQLVRFNKVIALTMELQV